MKHKFISRDFLISCLETSLTLVYGIKMFFHMYSLLCICYYPYLQHIFHDLSSFYVSLSLETISKSFFSLSKNETSITRKSWKIREKNLGKKVATSQSQAITQGNHRSMKL